MLNLLRHHRFHVPNGLAVAAAILLLASSVGGFNSDSGMHSSSAGSTPSVQAESPDSAGADDTLEQKRSGLNLGFLLFRRG